jgi:hypothetical protein
LTLDERIHQLWGPDARGEVYAVLDAAQDERLLPRIAGLDGQCLFDGELSQPLSAAAPWLVRLTPWSPLTAWLLEAGLRSHAGILLSSTEQLPAVRRHLRRFLLVRDDAGNELFFRYYDPRVLRTYLPTCNDGELELIFAAVDRFWIWPEVGDALVEWTRAALHSGSGASAPRHGLVIRRAQLQLMARLSDESFLDEMLAHVRTHFPRETAGLAEPSLRRHLEQAIAEARGYSLVRRQDLCRFINLTMLFGLAWAEREPQKWMHALMTRPEMTPAQRLSRLQRRCLYQLEAEDLGARP